MIRAVAGVLIASLLVAACSLGPAATPATNVALNIKDGTVDVPLDQALELTFSRKVDAEAVAGAFTVSPLLDGDLAGDADGKSFTFKPAKTWAQETQYTVILAAFKDAGGPVEARRWTFLTTAVPTVVAVTDATGAPVADGGGADQGGSLALAFNVPMDTGATKLTLNGAAADAAWSDDLQTATVSLKGVPVGTVELSLAAGKDIYGHVAPAWKLHVDLSLVIPIHTTHVDAPILVQVPNDGYGARPQVGLQAADMVFEYLTEGDITRLTAVFTDVPDVIGPIRSGRRISFRLTRHLHGVLFLSGLSNDATAVLHRDPVPAIFETTGPFYRDRSRIAPNNLFVTGAGGIYLAQGVRLPDFAIPKAHPALTGGDDGTAFAVAEHHSSYAYDANTGTYTKVEDGYQMVDAGLGQPLRAFMVVVMRAHEYLVPDIESGCCTHGRDFDLDAGGAADFWYLGKHYAGSWSAADRSSPFVFKLADGTVVNLPKGLVWIDVVGG